MENDSDDEASEPLKAKHTQNLIQFSISHDYSSYTHDATDCFIQILNKHRAHVT